jgi:fluoroacetyl-CoA thioesterase
MELDHRFHPGLACVENFTVEEQHLAVNVGSGSVRVLATPLLIAFMERLSHQLLIEHLPPAASSVGVMVNIRHVAPTPPGSKLRVRCEVLEVSGREVLFEVKAWDEQELVGEGQHQRVIIDKERFLRRVAAKTAHLER